jgi:hypothetical protein
MVEGVEQWNLISATFEHWDRYWLYVPLVDVVFKMMVTTFQAALERAYV